MKYALVWVTYDLILDDGREVMGYAVIDYQHPISGKKDILNLIELIRDEYDSVKDSVLKIEKIFLRDWKRMEPKSGGDD